MLAAVHVVLAASFSAALPYMRSGVAQGKHLDDLGSPDERAHVEYVAEAMRGDPLPSLDRSRPSAYENHQPPLYYWLDAIWARVWGVRDPFGQSAGLKLRSLNWIFGGASVLGVFFLSMWSGLNARTSLTAAALCALLPMNAALSGSVNNDPLTVCLCTWTLALSTLRAAGSSQIWVGVGVGICAGLAMLSKSTAVLLLGALAFASKSSSKPASRARIVAAGGLSVLVCGWWWVRNWIVSGDPFNYRAFMSFYPHTFSPDRLLSLHGLAHWLYVLAAGTALSFVGIFGYMDIHLPYVFYVPLLALLAAGLFAGLAATPKHILVFGGLILASYLMLNLSFVQPQARYLFPALGMILPAISAGWERLAGPRFVLLSVVALSWLAAADTWALVRLPALFGAEIR